MYTHVLSSAPWILKHQCIFYQRFLALDFWHSNKVFFSMSFSCRQLSFSFLYSAKLWGVISLPFSILPVFIDVSHLILSPLLSSLSMIVYKSIFCWGVYCNFRKEIISPIKFTLYSQKTIFYCIILLLLLFYISSSKSLSLIFSFIALCIVPFGGGKLLTLHYSLNLQ